MALAFSYHFLTISRRSRPLKNILHDFEQDFEKFLAAGDSYFKNISYLCTEEKRLWDSPKRIRVSLLGMCRLMPDGGNST